ncbi:MAG: transcription elongation factor [Undibacterium sp.]|nr:transcription elongation factor [Opitutaceae bacterium]
MDKAALRRAILAQLEAELATLTAAAHDAHAEATDEENRAEDKYDMRSQSAAYLAAGQAKLATELGEAIGAYQTLALPAFGPADALATGALVTLETRGQRTLYFLGPQRGGLELNVDGQPVLIVTAASPLGRQLIGRHLGESVMLPGRGGPAMQTIITVA